MVEVSSLKLKFVTLRSLTRQNLIKAKLHDHKAENERPTQSLHASWRHIHQFLQPRSRRESLQKHVPPQILLHAACKRCSFKSTNSNENNPDEKLSSIRKTYTGFLQSEDVWGQTDEREPTLRLQGLQLSARWGCTAIGAIHPNCQVALSNMESFERASVNLGEVSKSLNKSLLYHGS